MMKKGDNRNNQHNKKVVKEVGKNIECVVSEWSVWKECRVK
jgi:hypothetical protein